MKFPSIKTLAQSGANTFKRFPLAVLFALTGTIASTVNIELDSINRVGESWCIRVMMMANLGLLLSLAATLFAESRQFKPNKKYLLNLPVIILAACILLLLDPRAREADYARFFLLSLALHLLVAFAAFTKGYHIQGFWQFNKALFLRFLAAVLYSMVLYAGLAAAIGAMNYLFNFKFEWDTFSILFTWIAGMFSTTFFLAGVPADFAALDEDTSYPKGLKVFTQYVLIPLASVYVLILLAYEVKILIQQNLPKGSVSYLILSYAVFGILSLLLVYPIREQEENKWLKTYTRSFYFLMIPLLILLFMATGNRLSDYGITEFRYFLLMLSCWLLFITAYFLLSKKQNIKIIPVSLCLVTLFSVYGPQSAFSVSMYSQRHILIAIFKRNKSFKGGRLIPAKTMNKKDGERAADVLDYLVTHHDLNSLQPYLSVNLDSVTDSLGKVKSRWRNGIAIESYELRGKKLSWAKNYLGLSKFNGYYGSYVYGEGTDNLNYYYFQAADDVVNIKNYDFLTDFKEYERDGNYTVYKGLKFKQTTEQNKTYAFAVNNENTEFDVNSFAKKLVAGKKHFEKSKDANVGEYDSNSNNYFVPTDSLYITQQTAHYTITFAISDIRFNQAKSGDIVITSVSGEYLIKAK